MKKQLKKLSLSIETLRHLDRSSLEAVAAATAANTECGSACLCSATHVCSGCRPCF